MDSTGRLFVADRVNNRIQLFDQDGKFLEEWKQFGRPSGLYIVTALAPGLDVLAILGELENAIGRASAVSL
jgi:hypothetical protein